MIGFRTINATWKAKRVSTCVGREFALRLVIVGEEEEEKARFGVRLKVHGNSKFVERTISPLFKKAVGMAIL